jgi:Ca-activated chloride channel family protein
VAEFGLLLRDSKFRQGSSYDQVVSLARSAKGKDANGYRAEFIRLVSSVSSIAKK